MLRVFGVPSILCLSLEGGCATIALDIHLADGGVMNETVDGRERHGGIEEDPVPFPEWLVGRDEHGSALIACADQLEEHGDFSLLLGDIGEVVQDEQVVFVETGAGRIKGQFAARELRFLYQVARPDERIVGKEGSDLVRS